MRKISLNNVASGGVAMGRAFAVQGVDLSPAEGDITPNEVEEQIDAFVCARDASLAQIGVLAEKSDIFRAHLDLARSSSLYNGVVDKIKVKHKNAQQALKEMEGSLAARFELLEDPYMRERAADIRDICGRIMANLKGVSLNTFESIYEESIIIAHDLTPSDTTAMDFTKVKGFITQSGGVTSHTCIIARSLGLPAAVGQNNIMDAVAHGEYIIFDGEAGEVIIGPCEETIAEYRKKIAENDERAQALKATADLPAITADGRSIEIFANVGSIADAKTAKENGAGGIGLFRTEFLYMEGTDFPTEDEQFEVYKECAEIFGDDPIIIRTLDIGGDKALPYFNFPAEENPFLGWRAIRMCLDRQDVFKTQLLALLRASAFGNIHIMYPMIVSVEEYRRANALLEECKGILDARCVSYNSDIPTGIMIETPASVMLAEDFAREADFFSIGTNDLTQYILAVDRGNDKISGMYDSFHPAVLRAVKQVIDAGAAQGKLVGMCGEFAADKKAMELLLGMGLLEFSVSPVDIPSIKDKMRAASHEQAALYAGEVLAKSTVTEIKQILR